MPLDQPTILTLDRLERELPIMNWRRPLVVNTAEGSGLACLVCIAVVGLRAEEVKTLPQTWDEYAEHFRLAHDAEPDQEPQAT